MDTIAAIATPAGRGGVGIIRISGPLVAAIAQPLSGALPQPRMARCAVFRDADGQPIDQGLLLYFPGPASYTGEDVLEIQAHGGPVVLDLLMTRVLSLGARAARAGEFTERAFLNGKLDLAQAEAVADLIDASTAQAARSAQRALEGVFSEHIQQLQQQLTQLRVYVESAIDFVDEDIDFLAGEALQQMVDDLFQHFDAVQKSARQGQLLREGMMVVIAGKPNAGKSSLLNALAERESAIVTEIAGTTRDIIRENIQLDGMPLHLIDTAGLRDSEDLVEQEGVRRARAAMQQADRVLLLVDDREREQGLSEDIQQSIPAGIPVTTVYNKIDLTGRKPTTLKQASAQQTELSLSIKTGAGLEALRDHLKHCMGYAGEIEGVFIARRRHLDALQRARRYSEAGAQQLQQQWAGELFAEDLRQAQNALSEITGAMTSDDLLGEIFSHFCIGK